MLIDSSLDKSSQFVTSLGLTIFNSPEESSLVNDFIDTLTSLVLLFLSLRTPETNGSCVFVVSSVLSKFVTTWNGSVVGTLTLIVLTTETVVSNSDFFP